MSLVRENDLLFSGCLLSFYYIGSVFPILTGPNTIFPYMVIEADWDSWSVLYRCFFTDDYTPEYVYLINSRSKKMKEKDRAKAFKVLTDIGVYPHRLRPIKHGDDCVY